MTINGSEIYESIVLRIRPQLAASSRGQLGVLEPFAQNEAARDSNADILVTFQSEQRNSYSFFQVG